jgi:hypothetical protein
VSDEVEQWKALEAAMEMLAAESAPGERGSADVCLIYDATTSDEADHNCIGCNLKAVVLEVRDLVGSIIGQHDASNPDLPNEAMAFKLFVWMMNSYLEQLNDCFDIVQLDASYRGKQFAGFQTVRCWANFFKHPGLFAYRMHHPTFVIEGTKTHSDALATGELLLDSSYVKEFFGPDHDKKKKNHFELLEKATTCVVVIPNLVQLGDEIVNNNIEALKFLTFEPFALRLRSKGTIENFYCDSGAVSPVIAQPSA